MIEATMENKETHQISSYTRNSSNMHSPTNNTLHIFQEIPPFTTKPTVIPMDSGQPEDRNHCSHHQLPRTSTSVRLSLPLSMVKSCAGTPSAQIFHDSFVELYNHILHSTPELILRLLQGSSVLSHSVKNGMVAMKPEIYDVAPAANVVGNEFVELYGQILHLSPILGSRCFQDSNVSRRPDTNGLMTFVMTSQEEISGKTNAYVVDNAFEEHFSHILQILFMHSLSVICFLDASSVMTSDVASMAMLKFGKATSFNRNSSQTQEEIPHSTRQGWVEDADDPLVEEFENAEGRGIWEEMELEESGGNDDGNDEGDGDHKLIPIVDCVRYEVTIGYVDLATCYSWMDLADRLARVYEHRTHLFVFWSINPYTAWPGREIAYLGEHRFLQWPVNDWEEVRSSLVEILLEGDPDLTDEEDDIEAYEEVVAAIQLIEMAE